MSSITKVELQVIDDKLLIDAILAEKLPAEVGCLVALVALLAS